MHILQLHSDFCNYQVTFRNNTPATIKWFKEVNRYFMQRTGVTQIHEVDLRVVSDFFVRGKMERNWAAKTIKSRMTALSVFFGWCVRNEYMKEDPIKKLPKPKIEKRIPKHLTVAQASFALEYLKCHKFRYAYERSRALAIIAFFIYTGVRLSELLNLKFSEVDFKEKVIMIRSGKGNKDRIIPLIERLETYLKAFLIDRKRINDECIYFFVSLRRKQNTMSYLVVKRLFLMLSKKTGIHMHPHLMRHSYAVQMLEGGCDIFTLSKLLGHSDIKTTTIYLTATDAQKQRMAERHPLY